VARWDTAAPTRSARCLPRTCMLQLRNGCSHTFTKHRQDTLMPNQCFSTISTHMTGDHKKIVVIF
jgi:hypothetical protein